jgi:trimethylamine--corrinoid protein Co-methyltransferase
VLSVNVQFLPGNGCERVYHSALEVLERAGVKVGDEALIRLFQKRGAQVDEASGVVRIPRELVQECLATTGRRPTIRCVNGKTLHPYGDNRYYGSLILDPYIIDYDEGARPPRLSDVVSHARIGDYLEKVDTIYKMDQMCSDVPEGLTDLLTLEAFVSNTTTAYFCAPASLDSARTWVEVAEIMAGGSLRDVPLLIGYVATVSPLVFPPKSGEMLRFFLDRGVVVRAGPCPMAGATSPFTLAGTMVMAEAEILFFIVAAQVVSPGAPVLVAAGGHSIDMMGGHFLYAGPVKDLLHGAAIDMAAYHGLPCTAGLFSTFVSRYDMQNGYDTALGIILNFFTKNHIFGGMGSIANATGVSAEQIILHHNLIDALERMAEGIDVTDEKLAVESIVEAGPGGNFLMDDLTLKYLRSGEHYDGGLFVRCAPAQDAQGMVEWAHDMAQDIVRSHKPAVPEDRLEEVRRYVKKRRNGRMEEKHEQRDE